MASVSPTQSGKNSTWASASTEHLRPKMLNRTWAGPRSQTCSSESGRTTGSSALENGDGIETPITSQSVHEDLSRYEYYDADTTFIMVTGGLGYIGSHTTLQLLISGFNVIVVDNLSNSHDKVLNTIHELASRHCKAAGTTLPKLIFHELDFRSPAMRDVLSSYAIRAVGDDVPEAMTSTTHSRITSVIHFAAFKSVEESISKPLRYYQNNVCGLVDLLEALDDFNIRNFVFSSSATVYGDKSLRGTPLYEEDLVHHPVQHINAQGQTEHLSSGTTGITSPYGRTKSFAESILADIAYADPRWKITALRYFNPVGCHPSSLLGEDPRQKPTNLFPVIGRILTGDSTELSIFGNDWDTPDGTPIRDFIHILDLAKGHVAAASHQGRKEPFRAFNLGTGKGASVQEVVTAMEHVVGHKIPVKLSPRRAGDVGCCVAITDRAEKELGWKAELSLSDGARDMWNFLSKNKMEVA